MRNFKGPDFSDVRKAVPLESFFDNFLAGEGGGKGGRYSACPSCGNSGHGRKVSIKNGIFTCFKCGAHGDVIEAASLFFGVDKNKASLQLMGLDHLSTPRLLPVAETKPRNQDAVEHVIKTLLAYDAPLAPSIAEYLLGRGISFETQERARQSGLLRSLPGEDGGANFRFLKTLIGGEALEAAGMLAGERRFAPASYRPLICLSQNCKAAEFRLSRVAKPDEAKVLRYGQKSPFWFRQSSTELLLVEGAIDLLSALELGARSSIMGLPGVTNWDLDWFSPWYDHTVTLALDTDSAGLEQSSVLNFELSGKGCTVKTYVPEGKDLNEELTNTIAQFGPKPTV